MASVVDADQRSFTTLALVSGSICTLLAGLVVFLDRIDAPEHVLGLLRQLCTTAPHVTVDIVALVLASVPAIVIVLATVTAISIKRHTDFIVEGLRDERLASVPAALRDAARDAGVRAKLVAIDCPDLLVFVHGWLRPHVVVSTAVLNGLSEDELVAVLAHEAHHVQRRDPLRSFIADVAARSLVLFPVVRDLRDHFKLCTEVQADRRAIERCGRASLAGALLRFQHAPQLAGMPSMASQAQTRERLVRVLDPALPAPRLRLSMLRTSASIVVVCGLGLLSALLVVLPQM